MPDRSALAVHPSPIDDTRQARADSTPLVVLANRPTVSHERHEDGVLVPVRAASGLITAVEPLISSNGGTWIAHGTTTDLACADAVGRLEVNGGSGPYTLRYVPLTRREYEGYYLGFSNEALWPLCHAAHVQPEFRVRDFAAYRAANRHFAHATCDEVGSRTPVIFVQDYHLALAPGLLRRRLPESTIATFWHIPWPAPRTLRTCPWSRELVKGMLGSDIIGVQTDEDRFRFLDSVALVDGAEPDTASSVIRYQDRTVAVGAYPAGVDWQAPALSAAPDVAASRDRIVRQFALAPGVRIAVGVDRLDYTKGLPEKCVAIERLLEARPDLREHFVLIQVVEPSRLALKAYRELRSRLLELVTRINARFATARWRPIQLVERHCEPAEVCTLYRAADVCIVGSLDDGMNLVAKEFVAARDDEQGVLLLSEFAGSCHQLPDAVSVNPYSPEGVARAFVQALAMTPSEQAARMRAMRAEVEATGSRWWGERLVGDAVRAHLDQADVLLTAMP
jgi:trehalose 6-phosphate synthase